MEALIGQYQLFQNLSEKDYQIVAKAFEEVSLTNDEYFIRYDETSEDLFLVSEGHVAIEIDTVGYGTEVVANVGQGGAVGEFVLAKMGRRSANVKAVGPVKLLRTSVSQLTGIFQEYPHIGYNVYKNLAVILVERLKDTNMLARNAISSVMDLAQKINASYP